MSREYYGVFSAETVSPKSNNLKEIENIDNLKTIGLKLTKDQAKELITLQKRLVTLK